MVINLNIFLITIISYLTFSFDRWPTIYLSEAFKTLFVTWSLVDTINQQFCFFALFTIKYKFLLFEEISEIQSFVLKIHTETETDRRSHQSQLYLFLFGLSQQKFEIRNNRFEIRPTFCKTWKFYNFFVPIYISSDFFVSASRVSVRL